MRNKKMNREIKRPEHYEDLIERVAISQSGYGGILHNGNIVDRRQHPLAIPLQKNTMFGTPEPKEIRADVSR
jgi:hypothetical protein